MDMLFVRYACPFSLLDEMIKYNNFSNWIREFIKAENEKQIWETWLHKDTGKTYPQFKESVINRMTKVNEKQLEATVSNSQHILNNFIPEERG